MVTIMDKFKTIIFYFISFCLAGCQGDDNGSGESSVQTSRQVPSVQVSLIPELSEATEAVTLKSSSGQSILLSQADLQVDAPLYSRAELSLDEAVYSLFCPWEEGCGTVDQFDVIDVNNNSRIDQFEVVKFKLKTRGSLKIVTGENHGTLSILTEALTQVYESLKLESEEKGEAFPSLDDLDYRFGSMWGFDQGLMRLSMDPTRRAAELWLHRAFATAVFLARGDDSAIGLEKLSDAVRAAIMDNQVEGLQSIQQIALDYLALYNRYENLTKHMKEPQLSGLSRARNWLQTSTHPVKLEMNLTEQKTTPFGKDILSGMRDIIGVTQLNALTTDVDQRVERTKKLLDENMVSLARVLGNVLSIIAKDYPPFTTDSGVYTQDQLRISFNADQSTWLVTGSHSGTIVDLYMRMASFKLSASSTSFLNFVIEGTFEENGSKITLDTQEMLVHFNYSPISDPIVDANNLKFWLTSGIKLENQIDGFDGQMKLFGLTRGQTDAREFRFDDIRLDGQLTMDSDYKIQYSLVDKALNSQLPQQSTTMDTRIALTSTLKGAKSSTFWLFQNGSQDDAVSIRTGETVYRMNQRQELNKTHFDICTYPMACLKMTRDGRNYNGGLYVGDFKIGDVITIRRIPGVVFEDGIFLSLF